MSSNRQAYVDATILVDATLRNHGVDGPGVVYAASRVVRSLAEAGLLVTPQASSAERSEESLVSAIAESLRDFRLRLGPNTRAFVVAGQESVPLSGSERHEIAHAAASAYRQVTADE